jgi:hypothetical protein
MTMSTSGAGLGRGSPREEERVVLNVAASMSSYNPAPETHIIYLPGKYELPPIHFSQG